MMNIKKKEKKRERCARAYAAGAGNKYTKRTMTTNAQWLSTVSSHDSSGGGSHSASILGTRVTMYKTLSA